MSTFAACSVDNGRAPLRHPQKTATNALAGVPIRAFNGRVVWYDWPHTIDYRVRAYWVAQASVILAMKVAQRRHYSDSRMMPQQLAAHNCNNVLLHGQWGVFARTPLPAHCVLGAYGGRYLTCYAHMLHEHALYGHEDFQRYLFSANPITGGLPYISGLHAGNAITLVNDCRPAEANTPRHAQMNCRPVVMAWRTPHGKPIAATFYITTRAIAAGHEILADYGDAFWR